MLLFQLEVLIYSTFICTIYSFLLYFILFLINFFESAYIYMTLPILVILDLLNKD